MRPYKSPIGRRLPDYLFLACRAPLAPLVARTAVRVGLARTGRAAVRVGLSF